LNEKNKDLKYRTLRWASWKWARSKSSHRVQGRTWQEDLVEN